MLILNKKVLDLNDLENKDTARVMEGIKRLEKNFGVWGKNKKPLVFKYLPERVRIDPDNNGKKIQPAGYAIEYRESVPTKYGTEEWIYCETIQELEDNKKNYLPTRLDFREQLVVTEYNKDLAFFLMYCSKRVQGNYVADNNKQKYVMPENKVQDAQKQVMYEQNMAKTNHLIMSMDSPLNESLLRALAKSLLVSNVEDKTLDEVRMSLKAAVMRMEQVTKNGYQTFLHLVRGGANLEKRVLCQDAKEKRIIRLVVKGGERRWHWITVEGEIGDKICVVPPTYGAADEYLFEWVCDHDDIEGMLRLLLNPISHSNAMGLDSLDERDELEVEATAEQPVYEQPVDEKPKGNDKWINNFKNKK